MQDIHGMFGRGSSIFEISRITDKIFNIFHSGEHIKSNYNAGMLVLRPNLCVSNNFVHKVAVIV